MRRFCGLLLETVLLPKKSLAALSAVEQLLPMQRPAHRLTAVAAAKTPTRDSSTFIMWPAAHERMDRP
jgi:hypothetical protein